MSRGRKKPDITAALLRGAEIALPAALLVLLGISVMRVRSQADKAGCEQLETSVRRAVTACYALEGAYPQSWEYLAEHYGLLVDESRYTVHYTVTGRNILPEITVTEGHS